MAFTKGQTVEIDYCGDTFVATVVAWYQDLFTGVRMVGVDLDLDGLSPEISGADSEFYGYGDEGRVDLPETEVRPVS